MQDEGKLRSVYVPDNDDNDVKEYIRMRDDHKLYLKKVKQQILAFVLRQGKRFEGGKTYWTIAHLKWLKQQRLILWFISKISLDFLCNIYFKINH